MAFADRFGLYVFARVAVSRISETETGTGSTELPDIGAFWLPTQPEAYSVDVTRTGFAGYLGPGLLVRLSSRVNLDMGLTAGFGSLGKPEPRVEPGLTVENSVKYWYALGTWVGLVIGIG